MPADGRVVEADHLYVDEASLTGESAPAAEGTPRRRRSIRPPTPTATASSSSARASSAGPGGAVITATGARTSYGEIAHQLARAGTRERLPARRPSLRRADLPGHDRPRRSRVLAINIALQRPLLESLLFAIALAVGLTPELLPAIVTLNLTQGARALSRHGVLVKRLPAIQNLGSVTVLCTDKTGTLTDGPAAARPRGGDRPRRRERGRPRPRARLPQQPLPDRLRQPARRGDPRRHPGARRPRDLPQARRAPLRLHPPPAERRRPARRRAAAPRDEGCARGGPRARRATCARTTRRGRSTAAEHERLAKLVDEASADGFRLVAVGSRALAPDELGRPAAGAMASLQDADRLERDLVFEGVILFSDPPKAGVAETIAELARDGVALKVVTGDNDLVARHVAGQVGLDGRRRADRRRDAGAHPSGPRGAGAADDHLRPRRPGPEAAGDPRPARVAGRSSATSATASTTRPRSTRRMSGSAWTTPPTWPARRPTSSCSSRASPRSARA